jgi:hypothetical protein
MSAMDVETTKCPKCGLQAKVSSADQKIVSPLSRCRYRQGMGCEHLRKVLSAARQNLSLRRLRNLRSTA